MRFRPCIDLHEGRVKQIVGGTLAPSGGAVTNFVSSRPPSYYAALYRRDDLHGGHVIQLGPGNEAAARDALTAWPGGLQVGGGIDLHDARSWLDSGAAAVIVTSAVFRDGLLDEARLRDLSAAVGREKLVLDLSCRRRGDAYFVVTDRWQTFTRVAVNQESLAHLSEYCGEFLVHGVDREGLCRGIETDLVRLLGEHSPIPTTYAGGIANDDDLETLRTLGQDRLDFTVGSALDLFGGAGLRYEDLAQRTREGW